MRLLSLRVAALLLTASLVTACAGLPTDGVIFGGAGRGSEIAAQPVVSVVTTRKPVNGASADPWFGAERGRMSVAQVRLNSPAQAGRFSLAAAGLVDWQIDSVDIVPALSIGQPSAGDGRSRDVLLYVHGYNQTFKTATLDAARLSDGLSFTGETVLFSWPSRSKLLEYIRDRESALWSRDALEATLDNLLSNPNVGRVHIVAHSMGSMLTVEGLRQVYARKGDSVADRMGAIVFASPDLDIDGFSASVGRMRSLAPKMTIVTSTDDRAIAIATTVSGGARVGAAEKARLEALGLRVIDTSGLGGGIFNHDLFLTSAQVKDVIRRAIDGARQTNVALDPDAVTSAPLEAARAE